MIRSATIACQLSCPRVYDDMEDWCPPCRREWEADQEAQYQLRELARAHDQADTIPAATDVEWLRHLDDVAPLVMDLAGCPMVGDAS